jgi:hypothetical protein
MSLVLASSFARRPRLAYDAANFFFSGETLKSATANPLAFPRFSTCVA